MIVKTKFLDFSNINRDAKVHPFMIQFYTELANEVGTEGWIMIPHQPMVDWCEEYCIDEFEEVFSQLHSTFFFKNKEDALYFKTVWGSKDYPITNNIHWDRISVY